MAHSSSPGVLDDRLQQAVLHHLLTTHPAWQADDELLRVFHVDDQADGGRDDLMRALRDLSADGLVHRREDFTVLTGAAVRCADLFDVCVASE